MIESQPLYSISYNKPEKFVRLTWLGGTEAMTDQDFKESSKCSPKRLSSTARRG
jgi:hypothetical protein